jgi:hypothetical protein
MSHPQGDIAAELRTQDGLSFARSFARYGLLTGVCLLLSGCFGYQSRNDYNTPPTGGYQWTSLHREDYDSIAVPVFQSTSYERGLEFKLTRAVIQQIELKTPYKVLPRERAQTILEGSITASSAATLSQNDLAVVPQEQLLTVRCDFIWKDLRTGRILAQRKNVEFAARYYATLGEDRFIGQQGAVEKLALAIVEEMEADW